MGFIDKARADLEILENAYARAVWGSGNPPSPEKLAKEFQLLDKLEEIQNRYDAPDSVIEAAYFASYNIQEARELYRRCEAARKKVEQRTEELRRALDEYRALHPMELPPILERLYEDLTQELAEAEGERWNEYLLSPEITPRQHADKAAFLRAFLSRIPRPLPCTYKIIADIASELLDDPQGVSEDHVKKIAKE